MLAHIISSAALTECGWSVLSSRHNESEKRLPKSCLVVLCKFEPVLLWTKECDNLLYQTLVEILIPDVLRPIPSKLVRAIRALYTKLFSEAVKTNWQIYSMPGFFTFCYTPACLTVNPFSLFLLFTSIPASGALTQAIRNFAKSLENWLTGAMMNIPEEMVRIKVFV